MHCPLFWQFKMAFTYEKAVIVLGSFDQCFPKIMTVTRVRLILNPIDYLVELQYNVGVFVRHSVNVYINTQTTKSENYYGFKRKRKTDIGFSISEIQL